MKILTLTCLAAILTLSTTNVFAGGGNHGGYYNRHHGGHAGDYFIGGLIVANVLGHLSHHHRTHDTIASQTVSTSQSEVNHWLLLDLKGHCYEVNRQKDGTEVRKEVEKEVCEL
jgi:hypothetical protein